MARGSILFGYIQRGDLTPANKPDVQPPFLPLLYTLDLLLPVASLHRRYLNKDKTAMEPGSPAALRGIAC
jgi:hypothetical protein